MFTLVVSDEASCVTFSLPRSEFASALFMFPAYEGAFLSLASEAASASADYGRSLDTWGKGSLPFEELWAAVEARSVDAVEMVLRKFLSKVLRRDQANGRGGGGWSAVHLAASLGAANVLSHLITNGGDPNTPTDSGASPLTLASAAGHVDCAKLLLESGASTVMTDEDGNTPLHVAVAGSHAAIIGVLEEHSVDPSLANLAGNTPLHLAAHLGNEEMTAHLLSLGAPVAARSTLGATPLHEAAFGASGTVVELIVKAGAAIDAADLEMATPLQYAASAGSEKPLEALLALGANPNFRDMHGHTPLHHAAYEGNSECASKLLGGGASKLLRGENGMLPYMFAAAAGHKNIADLLIVPEPPVVLAARRGQLELIRSILGDRLQAAAETGGWGAMHEAAARGRGDVIDLLANDPELSSKVNVVTSQGQTPLMLAAGAHPLPLIRKLLDMGAIETINQTDSMGRTALAIAAKNGKADNCLALLRTGARDEIVDANGHTAHFYRNRTGGVDIAPLLRLPAEAAIADAVSAKDIVALRKALAAPGTTVASVECLDYWDRTQLQRAIIAKWYEGIQCLLDAGADPNR